MDSTAKVPPSSVMNGHVEFSCILTRGITNLKYPVDFRVVDESQVIESKWAKQ